MRGLISECVYLFDLDRKLGYTSESGDFELWVLRPTRYRLIFRPKIDGQVNFRVPPVKSEVISVGVGQHIEDFRFKVPAVRR